MAMLDFTIHCRVPEDPNGTLVPALGIKLPSAFVQRIPALRDIIRNLKSFSRITNEGFPNKEMTTKASWHICTHDEANPKPCVEEEI